MLSLTERRANVVNRAIDAGMLSPAARDMEASMIVHQLAETAHGGDVYAALDALAVAEPHGLFSLDAMPDRARSLPVIVVSRVEWQPCRESHDTRGLHDSGTDRDDVFPCRRMEPTPDDYRDALDGAELYEPDTLADVVSELYTRGVDIHDHDGGATWTTSALHTDGMATETTLSVYGLTDGEPDTVSRALSADDARTCDACGAGYSWRVTRCPADGALTSANV
jgi:hypothetical protein